MRQEIPALATRRRAHPARTVHSMVDDELRVSTHKSIIKTLGRQYTNAAQFFVELVVNSWMWGEATKVEIRIPESGSTIEYEEWGNGMDLTGLREFLTKGKLTDEGFSPKYKRPIRESYGMGSLAWLTVGKDLELQVHKGRFDRTITLTENLIDKHWDATDQSTWRPLRLIQAPLDHDRTHGLSRIQGWVNADFLRRLPGGNDFEHDSAQWRIFEKAMRSFVKNRVYKFLKQTASRRELRSIQYLNREIAERLRRSLRRNVQILSKTMLNPRGAPKINVVPGKTRKQSVLGERKRRRGKRHSREATRSIIHLKDQILAFDVAHGGDRGQAYVETDKSGVRTVFVNMDHPMWYVEAGMTPTKLRYCIRQILERSIAEEILPVSPSTPEETFSTLDALYNDALA